MRGFYKLAEEVLTDYFWKAEYGQIGPLPGATPTKSDQIRPNPTEFDQIDRIYQKSKSDQIRPNPTESDWSRPNPTESDQIRPNLTKSDQIQDNPTVRFGRSSFWEGTYKFFEAKVEISKKIQDFFKGQVRSGFFAKNLLQKSWWLFIKYFLEEIAPKNYIWP